MWRKQYDHFLRHQTVSFTERRATNSYFILSLTASLFTSSYVFTWMNKTSWPMRNVFFSHSDQQGENGLCSKRRRRSSLASGSIRSVDSPIVCFGFVRLADGTGWQGVQFHMVLKVDDFIIITVSIITTIICQIESVLWLKYKISTVQRFGDWLTDLLTDWLTYWLIYWLTDLLTDLMTYWLTELLTDWLIYWLTCWLTDLLTDWLTYWLTDLLTDLLTDWLTDWLTGLLTDLLTALLTYWLTPQSNKIE